MIKTVEVTEAGKLALPEEFCRKNKLGPGASLRVVEVGKALLVTPQEEPCPEDIEKLIAESGMFERDQTPEEEAMVNEIIAEFRKANLQRK